MKTKWKSPVIAVLIPLLTGAVSALLSMDGMKNFALLNKPPLSPPGWLFPTVWTVLYVLMGIASFLVEKSSVPPAQKRSALMLYGVQLFFNFFWAIIFFRLQQYLLALFWLLALWLLLYMTLHEFMKIKKSAGLLLLPYLAWVTFAGYLSFGIFLLN